MEIWKAFFLFCYSAARQLVVGEEMWNVFLLEAYQDSQSEEAILQSWIMSWSHDLEASWVRRQFPLMGWQNIIFVSEQQWKGKMQMFLGGNQSSCQRRFYSAQDCRRWQMTAEVFLTLKGIPAHVERLGHTTFFQKMRQTWIPSVTVLPYQNIRFKLTSTKSTASEDLVQVVDMFA